MVNYDLDIEFTHYQRIKHASSALKCFDCSWILPFCSADYEDDQSECGRILEVNQYVYHDAGDQVASF